MARLQIDGVGTVEIDDSFKSMTHQAQNDFVSQIVSHAKSGVRSSDDIGQQEPQQTAEELMAGPEGQQLAGELRNKADKMLLEHAGATSPAYAGFSSAMNTGLLNIPRNVGAAVRTLKPGAGSFGEEYQYLKDIDEAAARQSPYASGLGTAAGLVGSVAAVPIAPAASLIGRAGQSAALGAGASGIGEFADTKDLGRAGAAAVGGAVLGAAGAPIAEGLARGAGALGRGVAGQVRALTNPAGEGEIRVARALAQDAAVAGQPLDEMALSRAQQGGQPVVAADIGGKATMRLARSAANTSPEARHALETVGRERFESQAPRISEFVTDLGGGADAVTAREALLADAAKLNARTFPKAFAIGESGIWNENLARLAQAPVVADAIKSAPRTLANKSVSEGFPPVKNPFDVSKSGEVTLSGDAKPTLRFWDAVKHDLDTNYETLISRGQKSAAFDVVKLKEQLLGVLDENIPAYKEARAGAAGFFGQENALDAGKSLARAKGKNSENIRLIAKMNEPERKLLSDGYASQLAVDIAESPDRRNAINSIFNSPAAKQRVEMAMGKTKAKELEAFLNIESVMDRLRNEVSGNSSTARQIVELGLAGGVANSVLGGDFSTGAMFGSAARFGKFKIDERIARKVGESLASGDPDAFRRVVKLASKSSAVMGLIKTVESRLGAVAPAGAEGVGRKALDALRPVAGQTPAHAENDDPNNIPAVRRQ